MADWNASRIAQYASRSHTLDDSAPARLSYDRGTLTLTGALLTASPLPTTVEWNWDPRVDGVRCDALHYASARDDLAARYGANFTDLVPCPAPVAMAPCLPKLRSEQRSALEAWRESGRRATVIMPTGSGKTEIGIAAMADAGVATLVVAPIRELMHQWSRRLAERLRVPIGRLGDGIHDVRPVTATTYESATLYMPELGDRFGFVIFDEVHHLPSERYRESAVMCAAPMRLGLTATPERPDGLHVDLDDLVGPIVHRMEIMQLRGQSLADYDIRRIAVRLSDEEQRVHRLAGRVLADYMRSRQVRDSRYDWNALCCDSRTDPAARRALRAFYHRRRIEDRAEAKLRVLDDLLRLHVDERVLVFVGSNDMARDVAVEFLVPCVLADIERTERREVLDGFREGHYPVIVANRVLDEGIDVPEAKVAVVLGGEGSTRQAKQRLGRVLRRVGDARATLYEVVVDGTRDVLRSKQRNDCDAFTC